MYGLASAVGFGRSDSSGERLRKEGLMRCKRPQPERDQRRVAAERRPLACARERSGSVQAKLKTVAGIESSRRESQPRSNGSSSIMRNLSRYRHRLLLFKILITAFHVQASKP